MKLKKKIKNLTLLEYIYKNLNYLDLSIDKQLYNDIIYEIKNIIKTSYII
jgi:hypothetical protein